MRLRELMKKTNTKQYELAESLQISRAAISLYVLEKREPDIETLIKLADYFGVTVDYLIGHDAAPDKTSQSVSKFIYLNDKKYEIKQNALVIEIGGLLVDVSFLENET